MSCEPLKTVQTKIRRVTLTWLTPGAYRKPEGNLPGSPFHASLNIFGSCTKSCTLNYSHTSCILYIHKHDSVTTSIWHFFHFKGFLWSVCRGLTENMTFSSSLFSNKPAHAGKYCAVVIHLWGSWLHIKVGCYQHTVRLSLIRSYDPRVYCISQVIS